MRKLREDRKWSQAQLGAKAGVGRTTVLSFEASSKANQEIVERLVSALKISMADLYTYAEPISLSAESREWLAAIEAVPEQKRADALNFARRLAQTATASGAAASVDQPTTAMAGSPRSRKS